MLEPTQIGVEYVARNEPGSDPAGDRLKFAVADQRANLVLGAAELNGNLTDGEWSGPVHHRSIARSRAPLQHHRRSRRFSHRRGAPE